MTRKALWASVTAGVGVAAVASAIAIAVPAAAATGGQGVVAGHTASLAPSTAPSSTATCDRLKKRDDRRQATLSRLQGDAQTRGSIAWLTAKAAEATTSGNEARAQLYTDKAALRSALVDPLKKVEADLAAVIKASCS